MLLEKRLEKIIHRKIELEEGEVLNGDKNAAIFLNRGVKLIGEFKGCVIEP